MTINETFVGYRLTTASRDRLLKHLPAQYDKVVADHITTDFLGNQPFFPSRKRGTGFLPPKPKSVLVIGHAHDQQRGIHAAVLSIDGHEHQGMDPDRRLHVTISHGKNARPVHSNDAIKKGWTRLDKPIPLEVIPMSAGSVDEGLEGVQLSEPRRDSRQRQLVHFDIVHPKHGKIGSLSGGRVRVGGERVRHEMEPGVEYSRVPKNTKRGGKTSFMITNVGVDGDAVARIHGVEGYDKDNPQKNPEAHRRVRELTPHVLGHAAVRDLGRQLRKKMRVTMVSGNTRISGVRSKVGKTSFQSVSPIAFREDVSDLVDRMVESRDVPHEIRQATPETQKKFADALKSGLSHRQQVKQRLSQYDDVIKGVSDHIGQPAYLVGGAVRDAFLGRENKDVDLVTVGGQKKLEDLGYKQIKGDFPVYTHQKFPGVEVALARGEKKVGAGHTGFAWHTAKSLDPDLQRRDLTVNAMAYHPSKGIIDPHGGQRDIADGYLRHVGKHFAEDPLRSFRVARFASQTGMEVHPSTIAMMRSTKKELPSLSKDRVREEMTKALKSKAPRQYFDTLHKAGILKVWHPEVAALKGKPSSLPHHGDAYDHTMSALQHAAATGQSHDTRHLLLTQQMPEASIAKHGERFGMSKQEVSRLQTHASVHTVPFQPKGSADQSIAYWSRTQPNALQPDHQAATEVNASVSGTAGNREHYQQVFDRLGGVKFSAADFQGKKGPEISQYKQHRWRDALSGIAETVSRLVDLMIEGRVRIG